MSTGLGQLSDHFQVLILIPVNLHREALWVGHPNHFPHIRIKMLNLLEENGNVSYSNKVKDFFRLRGSPD